MINISQIHLVHLPSQKRTVVHVGRSVGRSENEVTLQNGHPPVRLRLRPTAQRDVQIDILSGDAITINGKPAGDAPLVKHGGSLDIGGQPYRVEIFGIADEGRRPPRIIATWFSGVGPVRDSNQDAIGILRDDGDAQLFVIADGVSNAEAGDVVSKFAVQYTLSDVHQHQNKNPIWGEVLHSAFLNVNAQVRLYGQENGFAAGSTLTALVIHGWDAIVAHVGDTRLYHWNATRVRQVTTDHATFAEGTLDPEKRAQLTRGIGKADELDPEQAIIPFAPGDKFLLCSDGVTDGIDPNELFTLLRDTPTADLPKTLVRLSNERGNTDNLSLIVIEIFEAGTRITPIVVPVMDRAFVGYNPNWVPILQTGSFATHHPVPGSRLGWAVAAVALLALLLLGLLLALLRDNANTSIAATATALSGAAFAADGLDAGGSGSGGGLGDLAPRATATAAALSTQFAQDPQPALGIAITATAVALNNELADQQRANQEAAATSTAAALSTQYAENPQPALEAAITATAAILSADLMAQQRADLGAAITSTAGVLMTQYAENQGAAFEVAITGTAAALMTQFADLNATATPTRALSFSAFSQPTSTLRPLPTVTLVPPPTRVRPTAVPVDPALISAPTAVPVFPTPTCTPAPNCICVTVTP